MKKPLLNQEERQLIIQNTYEGAKLNVWLKLQMLKRDCNFLEWWLVKRMLNKSLKQSIKFKVYN